MRGTTRTRRLRGAGFLLAGVVAFVSGCGDDDFERTDRPPPALQLTGVIQSQRVTVSPDKVGAGPVSLTISNQTDDAHTVTLAGEAQGGSRIEERVGPIAPLDTATIQKTLPQGSYEVRAGSEVATPREIRPAELTVGAQRASGNDQLLLP